MSRLPPWRRYLALGLAAVAVLVLAMGLVPNWPQNQHVVFQVQAPENVESIVATWTREGDDSPRGGTKSSFASGAPSRIDRELSLPNGTYIFAVGVKRRVGRELVETSREHRVRLEGREVTVFITAASRP